MPDWAPIAVVIGLFAIALVFVFITRHFDKRSVAKSIEEHTKRISKYLNKKREVDDETEDEKKAIPKPKEFSLESALEFIKRSKEK